MNLNAHHTIPLGCILAMLAGSQAAAHVAQVGRIIGHIDGVAVDDVGAHVYGWACQQGRPESITVHIYANGGAYEHERHLKAALDWRCRSAIFVLTMSGIWFGHVRRTFKEGRFQEPKTRTSYRRLSLPTFLLKELKVWRQACPNSPYDLIFPNLDGRPMSHSNLMQRGFFPALQRAGIRRIRFHDLRHTFASLMISNGKDIVRVSRLMGPRHRVLYAECLQPHACTRARSERRSARILGFWKQNGNCCQSANSVRAGECRKLEQNQSR